MLWFGYGCSFLEQSFLQIQASPNIQSGIHFSTLITISTNFFISSIISWRWGFEDIRDKLFD